MPGTAISCLHDEDLVLRGRRGPRGGARLPRSTSGAYCGTPRTCTNKGAPAHTEIMPSDVTPRAQPRTGWKRGGFAPHGGDLPRPEATPLRTPLSSDHRGEHRRRTGGQFSLARDPNHALLPAYSAHKPLRVGKVGKVLLCWSCPGPQESTRGRKFQIEFRF